MGGELQLTIDLASEIRNITQKQHLNDVHYAVQLVRHALLHHAPAIHINTSRARFEIAHEGAAFSDEERDLLFAVLTAPTPEVRQAALSRIEVEHGVAILSLLAGPDEVEVESERSFRGGRGQIRATSTRRARGFRIVVHRSHPARGDERRELAFYCRCSDVPVFVNGRQLKQESIEVPDPDRSFLDLVFKSTDNVGLIGLARQGSMSRQRYFKHGIYFGVRQHLPSDQLPLEAAYNSRTHRFEENFKSSVRAASTAIRAARQPLLGYVAHRYRDLSGAERARVRSILLGMAERRWTASLRDLPLFDTGAQPAALSLAELERSGLRRGFVAWLPRGDAPGRGPRSRLPVLDEQDVLALRRLLSVPLRRAVGAPVRLHQQQSRTGGPALSSQDVPEAVAALVQALAEVSDDETWVVTANGHRTVEETATGPVICLPVADPLLVRCADIYRRDPRRLDVIRAALAAPA